MFCGKVHPLRVLVCQLVNELMVFMMFMLQPGSMLITFYMMSCSWCNGYPGFVAKCNCSK